MGKNVEQVAHNGVRVNMGAVKWTDEEAKKLFTDGEGRLHSVVFLDQNSGVSRFGR